MNSLASHMLTFPSWFVTPGWLNLGSSPTAYDLDARRTVASQRGKPWLHLIQVNFIRYSDGIQCVRCLVFTSSPVYHIQAILCWRLRQPVLSEAASCSFTGWMLICVLAFPNWMPICVLVFSDWMLICVLVFPDWMLICVLAFPDWMLICVLVFPDWMLICVLVFPGCLVCFLSLLLALTWKMALRQYVKGASWHCSGVQLIWTSSKVSSSRLSAYVHSECFAC